jgi:hypothetical protein
MEAGRPAKRGAQMRVIALIEDPAVNYRIPS